MSMRALAALLMICACAACAGQANPPGVGNPGTDIPQISGNERLGWSQQADPSEDLTSYHFFLYVDSGSRSELANVACAPASQWFECSGSLPSMAAGTHTLELSAAASDGVESARSTALQVRVVRLVASGASATAASATSGSNDGRLASGAAGAQLAVHVLAAGLSDPTDMAIVPDGRVFIAERSGRLHLFDDNRGWSEPAIALDEFNDQAGGGLLAIAVDPDFAQSGFLYTVYTASEGFRLARFHLVDGAFVERVVVLDGIPAAARPAAALRFGPDGRLYVGFDDGGEPAQAGDFGSYNGKVLRINADGSVPADQTGLTPVWTANVSAPRALDWAPSGGALWLLDAGVDRPGRLDAIVADGTQSRRGKMVSQYGLPDGAQPSGLAAYRGDLMPDWKGNLLVSLGGTQELLRLRLDTSSGTQVLQTEQVLSGEAGSIRAVAMSPIGSLYLLNEHSLLEVRPIP